MRQWIVPKQAAAVEAAASKDDPRYSLQAISLEIEGEKLLAVATDGHALVVARYPIRPAEDFPLIPGLPEAEDVQSILVPVGFLSELAKATPKKTAMPILENVMIFVSGGKVWGAVTDLESPTVKSAPIPDGRFPSWRNVVPAEPGKHAAFTLDGEILGRVLKTMGAAAGYRNGETKPVRFGAPIAKEHPKSSLGPSVGPYTLHLKGPAGEVDGIVMPRSG
jgi:hypothetical protein